MNSREKGKRGERQWRDELRAEGFHARRGQQFAGGADSPDVVCEELRGFHFEVKAVERLNIEEAMEQARNDARGQRPEVGGQQDKMPVVAHRRKHRRWLVTMKAETFFRLLRGDYPGDRSQEPGGGTTEGNKGHEGPTEEFQI
jgi:Holliday junction resolvase